MFSNLYSSIPSGTLRLILRVYFILCLFLLGIIGRQCSKLAVKRDILDGHRVCIHRMTGWLKSEAILDVIWKFRRLPGGWFLGILMIVGSIISLTADIIVASLVGSEPWPDNCHFTTGLVMDWAHNESFTDPPSNSWVATIASNAQYISFGHDCEVGIYRKVPGNQTELNNFCATSADVMGSWSCPQINEDKTFDAYANVSTIIDSLHNDDLQYTNNTVDDSYIDLGYNGSMAHFVVWSSNAPSDEARVPFNVLVSADINPVIGEAVVMRTFNCSVAGSQTTYLHEVNKVLAQIQSYTALRGWQAGLEAVLYSGAGTGIGSESQQGLEIYLNSMTMVQGGNDSIIGTKLSTDTNPNYGCLTNQTIQTIINETVIIMVVLAAVLFLILAIYYLYLLSILKLGSRDLSGSKNIKPIPDSTLSWMLQAARENAISKGIVTGENGRLVNVPRKIKELRGWRFEVTDSVVGVARVTRERERGGLGMPGVGYQDYFEMGRNSK